ncbi:unnamed protein product [Alopecurus aequalis]
MAAFAKIATECIHDPLIWLILASLSFVILQMRRLGRAPFPPGPKPLPIIGNMSLVDQLTHRGLGAMAKHYGGLLHLRFGWLHVFVVSTPEYAREVLHAQDGAFSNRPATIAVHYLTYGRFDMAFAHNGAYWRQMRKLCVTKIFSRRRAETWTAVRDGYGALARAVGKRSGEAVNLGELIFNLTVSVIFGAAFSARDDGGLDEFVVILQEFSRLMGLFHIGDFFPWLSWVGRRGFDRRLRTARGALDRFIDKIVDEHMSRGKNAADADADLVDGLLAFLAEADPASGKQREDAIFFTRHNVKTMIMDMLFGGPETDADAFRPSRFMPGEGEAAGLDFKGGSYEFIPFGSGRRSCPAQGLGQHAVEFAVAQLAHGFNWELPDGMKPAELDMSDIFGLTTPRATRLYAVPTPRLTCPL